MALLTKLVQRAVVGLALLGVLFGSAWIGGWPWLVFVAVLAVVAMNEYYSAIATAGYRADRYLGWLCAVIILVVAHLGEDIGEMAGPADAALEYGGVGVLAAAHVLQITLFVLLLCVAGTLVSQFKLHDEGSQVANSATTVFGVVYIGILLSFLVRIRYLDIPAVVGVETTSLIAQRLGGLLFVIVSVWACDSFAYIGGNLLGKHKLAPEISPNKTIEGSISGFLAAIVGALLIGVWLGLPARHCIALGAMMGVLGQVGDLCKSVLKRDLGIKDFSSLFGPHGGVLDRFDAILVCIPLVYWYFWFFWIHPA